MLKKDFSFKYDIKTKTGKILLDNKYIKLDANETKISSKSIPLSSGSFLTSSSDFGGYGLHLLRRKK